jgi:tryptophan synthase alpha chain
MSLDLLFRQIAGMRPTIRVPVLLMGYMNPVLQYGFEKFCEAAAMAGVDGLILPDLPMYEFETEYGPVIKKYGLDFVFLVTPETSPERIRKVDALSTGFLYAVSSSSTTGGSKDLADQEAYFLRLEQMKLRNPVLVGFGVRDKDSFEAASRHTNGAIIGTAYIRALEDAEDIGVATKTFLSTILS